MRIIIISLPLISSFSIYFFGRYIGHKGGARIAIGTMVINILISIIGMKEYLEGKIIILRIKEWFEVGMLKGVFDLIYDKESIIMTSLITIITFVVIVYSYWYLAEDPHLNRFISKLLLFSVSMYILVASKNFLFTFFGWELVGVVSYLLINFWSISIQNNKSAIKAVLFNKVGDIFYLLGLIIIGVNYYTFDYSFINSSISSNYHQSSTDWYTYLAIFFIIAAMAKSAQIFLHNWLGDAMAGPTPVSALLHAATMVTAGIFIIIRCEKIIENSNIDSFIIIIGTLTILFAGLSSLNQNDIKKVIAYSTCAQIGFMFFALGIYKPLNSSLYHLVTHGFFKALLFLSAGLIIHSLMLEQDLRKYGALVFFSPLYYLFFFLGSLAIIGFPPLSGFFSKDLILLHSLQNSLYSFIVLIIGSVLSSFYSFKLLFYAFFNAPLAPIFSSFHSLPSISYIYIMPFILLLGGSLFLGFMTTNIFSSLDTINLDLELAINHLYFNFKLIPFLLPFFSIVTLFFYYYPRVTPLSSSPSSKFFHLFYSFFNRKFLFDPFYNYFITRPIFSLSYHLSFKFLDRGLLEFFGPISLFRLFFFFPSHFSLSSQSYLNSSYLFFYFFLSFLILFLPLPFLL